MTGMNQTAFHRLNRSQAQCQAVFCTLRNENTAALQADVFCALSTAIIILGMILPMIV